MNPAIIMNNKLGGSFSGDFAKMEHHAPQTNGINGNWEVCDTINDTWGFKSNDQHFKSATEMLRMMIDIVSRGGNYLLNVGPDARGSIPDPEVRRLREIGAWLNANGEAIYGASPSPFKTSLGWGRWTQKGQKLYLSIFFQPPGGKLTVPILNQHAKAWLLQSPDKTLDCTADKEGIEIQLPSKMPDSMASVVVVDPGGQLQLSASEMRADSSSIISSAGSGNESPQPSL